MADMPARIGPYRLLSRLGAGGMAETYVAVRHGPGDFTQRVCLKRIRHDLDRDPEFVRQFMAEAAIAARLRHAAIAQIFDFGRSENDYFMAFELIDGMDLRELLRSHPGGLPGELVLYLAIELATALDFAHRGGATAHPIVHRDVSASNALLSLEGEVKLADFGIARAAGDAQHTRTGMVKGKVPYVAPEYARTGRFDARSDLFSLGVLLYECACGERPHDDATDLLTLERAARAEHTALGERAPALPPELTFAIEQLLRPDPGARFQSASALLETLLRLPLPAGTRRELGSLVTRTRAPRAEPTAESEAMTLAATDPLGPTRQARTLAARTRTRPQEAGSASEEAATALHPASASKRRGTKLALAVATSCAVAALAFAWLGSRADPVAFEAASTVTAVQEPAAPQPAAPKAAAQPGPEASAVVARTGASPEAPLSAARSGRAELEVVVLPYGQVTIDGKPQGLAPIKVRLAPGRHVVTSSGPNGASERRITLSPGEQRQLVLR